MMFIMATELSSLMHVAVIVVQILFYFSLLSLAVFCDMEGYAMSSSFSFVFPFFLPMIYSAFAVIFPC